MTKQKVIALGAGALALAALARILWPALAPAPTASRTQASIPAPSPDDRLDAPTPREPSPTELRKSDAFNDPFDADSGAWRRAIVEELVRRDEAESLLVAALLSTTTYRPAVAGVDRAARARYEVELLQRASMRAPGDPVVQWRAWSACRSLAEAKLPCDAAPFERGLRAADPENAWPSVAALEIAIKDGRDVSGALAAVAELAGFDVYPETMFPMILDNIESARVPPPASRPPGVDATQAFATGLWAEEPVPTMKPMLDLCKVAPNDPLAGSCRAIAAHMRRSDSYLVRRVGLGMAERLAPEGSADSNALREERRRLDWVDEQIRNHQISLESMRRLLPAAGGEVEFFESWLRENGVPLLPPADWTKPTH